MEKGHLLCPLKRVVLFKHTKTSIISFVTRLCLMILPKIYQMSHPTFSFDSRRSICSPYITSTVKRARIMLITDFFRRLLLNFLRLYCILLIPSPEAGQISIWKQSTLLQLLNLVTLLFSLLN